MIVETCADVVAQVRGQVGFLTLNRPKALNALTLDMVRALQSQLLAWKEDPRVLAVAIRGSSKDGFFGHFCAGGDIRFLHQAGSAGNPQLEDFFTEEYALNHLIFSYPKPYIAFMDGVVMGGGMGLSQGASWRVVTERTKMAMPETLIGLFPDVGGGYFLSRCPGAIGEWLALTGESLHAAEAIAFHLADAYLPAAEQAALWEALGSETFSHSEAVQALVQNRTQPCSAAPQAVRDVQEIDRIFALPTLPSIMQALESDSGEWAQATAAALRKRSPLMLYVTLEQIRRARRFGVAADLRMERDMMRHCFALRPGQSESLEGIRALAVDKDHHPRWNPSRIEAVPEGLWKAFFSSPWPVHAHPLAHLKDRVPGA